MVLHTTVRSRSSYDGSLVCDLRAAAMAAVILRYTVVVNTKQLGVNNQHNALPFQEFGSLPCPHTDQQRMQALTSFLPASKIKQYGCARV